MAEYVPDSPTSVASSEPHSPPFSEDEDVLFPYWEWRALLQEEWAARVRLLEQEHSYIQWIGEQLLSLAHRLLLYEETAGRFWVRSLESEACFVLKVGRLRFIHAPSHYRSPGNSPPRTQGVQKD